MLISEKQIMHLMNICRRYINVCNQMRWDDHYDEANKIHNQIENQQSEKLKVVDTAKTCLKNEEK